MSIHRSAENTGVAVRSGVAHNRSSAIVIGAGIAGLTAAYELLKGGVIPVVLEASDRVGGFLAPLPVTDVAGREYVLDAGADSFATRSSVVSDLVAELGLKTVKPVGSSAWCFPAHDDPFPLPSAGVLGIPFDWDAPDLLRALGTSGVERARADEWLNTGVGDRSNLAAFVESRMGAAVVDRLVRPIAGGVHSTDPEKLDVTAIHPRFWEIFEAEGSLSAAVRSIRAAAPAGAKVLGVEGGLHRIISALHDHIVAGEGRVVLGCKAQSLTRTEVGWEVTVSSQAGASSVMEATQVVLALPAEQALKLLASAGIVATQEARVAPRGTDISLVTVVVDSPVLAATQPRGTGALIAPGGQIAAKGTTHVNAKWEWLGEQVRGTGTNLIRFSYGRHGDTDVFTDQELVRMAVRDFEAVYGLPAGSADAAESKSVGAGEGAHTSTGSASSPVGETAIMHTHVVRWNNALAPVTPELKALSTRVSAQVDELAGLGLTGAWVSGTGLAAVIPHAQNAVTRMKTKFREL